MYIVLIYAIVLGSAFNLAIVHTYKYYNTIRARPTHRPRAHGVTLLSIVCIWLIIVFKLFLVAYYNFFLHTDIFYFDWI